jgi:protein-L-isoaspartate(D-aspartate) O-methyltransferase
MAWRSHGSSNAELVTNLWNHRIIKTDRVRDALLLTDRLQFVPPLLSRDAYMDCPQVREGEMAT